MTYLPHASAPRLTDMQGITHGFLGRKGGVSAGLYESLNVGIGSDDKPRHIADNRAIVAEAVGAPDADHLLSCYQIHSATVIRATEPWTQRPEGDAMVTATPDLALCIVTADCVPVLFADPKARIIGAAHAGWKGALGGVLEATFEAMLEMGAKAGNIHCAIGPCIQQKSYEVGAEFRDTFLQTAPWSANLFTPGKGDKYHFNLQIFVKNRLTRLKPAWIDLIDHDTYSMDAFYYSNRRRNHMGEPDYGRNASVIMLKE